jgi:hypothetical protein
LWFSFWGWGGVGAGHEGNNSESLEERKSVEATQTSVSTHKLEHFELEVWS